MRLVTRIGPRGLEADADATRRAGGGGGSTVAIVGERGTGKTSALRRIAEQTGHLFLDAGTTGLSGLRAALANELGLSVDLSLDALAARLEERGQVRVVLIDDVQHFVQPILGGLAGFDELLAVATRHAGAVTWVFAFDSVIWPFLERARDTRPAFDEVVRIAPWREEEIVSLLRARTEQAGVAPSFEHLLDRLPADADEIDLEEATEQTRRRLLPAPVGLLATATPASPSTCGAARSPPTPPALRWSVSSRRWTSPTSSRSPTAPSSCFAPSSSSRRRTPSRSPAPPCSARPTWPTRSATRSARAYLEPHGDG